jgi:hypothetical protein
MMVVVSIISIVVGATGIGISLASSRDAEQGGRAVDIALSNARLSAMSRADSYEVRITKDRVMEVFYNGAFQRVTPAIPGRVLVNIDIPSLVADHPDPHEVRLLFNKASGRVEKVSIYDSAGGLLDEYTHASTPRIPTVVRLRVTNDRNAAKVSTIVLITNTGRQYILYGQDAMP